MGQKSFVMHVVTNNFLLQISIKIDSSGTQETCDPSMLRSHKKLLIFATLLYDTFSGALKDNPSKTN